MLLLWGGVAFGASAGNPPAGTWSGHYKVTYKVTNVRGTPSHWIYAAQPLCSSPCHAVSFRLRLVSEKSWRSAGETYHWNGKAYTRVNKLPKSADCRAKSGATVTKGYDVTTSTKLHVRAVTKGRVMRWSGTEKDAYMPNVAGRKHHCSAGAYLYTLNAVAQ